MFNDFETLYTYKHENKILETYSFEEALQKFVVYKLKIIENELFFQVDQMLLPLETDPIAIIRALSLRDKIRIVHKRKLLRPIHSLYNDTCCQVCHKSACLLFSQNSKHKFQVCHDHLSFLTEMFEASQIANKILQKWNTYELNHLSFLPPEVAMYDIRHSSIGQHHVQTFKALIKDLLDSISKEQLLQYSKDFPEWLLQTLDLD